METFITIIRESHSGVRWLVVLLGLIIIIKHSIGWAMKSEYSALDRRLVSIFSAVFGIQFLLGLLMTVLYLITGRFVMATSGAHLVIMLIAFFVAMRTSKWKNAEGVIPFRNNVIALVIAGLLIYVGVLGLPVGWSI